jgi:outer membrane immunogenic protein
VEYAVKRFVFVIAFCLAAASRAVAADIPSPGFPEPPPPRAPTTATPPYNWGGIYFGINGGYGFGGSTWTAPATSTCPNCTSGSFDTDGFLIGGTVGVNFQPHDFVFGAEADLDWTKINGSVALTNTLCGTASCQTANDWLGTVRSRFGLAVNRFFVFGTAGGAFGNIQAGRNPPGSYDSSTQFGWTAGVGAEYAVTENLTAKAEYLFVDLGSSTCAATASACGTVAAGSTVSLTANLVRLGVNFKFIP